MLIWDYQLRSLGFDRKSERYWCCARHFGLPANAHLSIFGWSELPLRRSGRVKPYVVEVNSFHVTYVLPDYRLRFFYNEHNPNEWIPRGFSSARDKRMADANRGSLRAKADAVARELVESWFGRFVERRGTRQENADDTS